MGLTALTIHEIQRSADRQSTMPNIARLSAQPNCRSLVVFASVDEIDTAQAGPGRLQQALQELAVFRILWFRNPRVRLFPVFNFPSYCLVLSKLGTKVEIHLDVFSLPRRGTRPKHRPFQEQYFPTL